MCIGHTEGPHLASLVSIELRLIRGFFRVEGDSDYLAFVRAQRKAPSIIRNGYGGSCPGERTWKADVDFAVSDCKECDALASGLLRLSLNKSQYSCRLIQVSHSREAKSFHIKEEWVIAGEVKRYQPAIGRKRDDCPLLIPKAYPLDSGPSLVDRLKL